MNFSTITEAELAQSGATHTAREIHHQPAVWGNILERIQTQHTELEAFLKQAYTQVSRIILTGAGTSAYIGISLRGVFLQASHLPTDAIPTTDIVSHPADSFHADVPLLLVSFARSGDSPESLAAVELADQFCTTCYHLIITCNPEGKLATYQSRHPKMVFLLPPECNDKSLAMTSSYSGMLLSGLLIARLQELEAQKTQVRLLQQYGQKILTQYSDMLQTVADSSFERAVFLGSGPLFGTATESHLKLQELTDGRIICKNESFLGFRHGPKAVIDEKTLVVYFFSNDLYVQQYEVDLVKAMRKGRKAAIQVGISETAIPYVSLDYSVIFKEGNGSAQKIDEVYLTICSVLVGQLLGFFKALDFDLMPDNPSISGAISRVVEGVTIYPMK